MRESITVDITDSNFLVIERLGAPNPEEGIKYILATCHEILGSHGISYEVDFLRPNEMRQSLTVCLKFETKGINEPKMELVRLSLLDKISSNLL